MHHAKEAWDQPGIDNDCDGLVDEYLNRNTTCGLGICAGNVGYESCSNGLWVGNTCNPLLGSVNETCDNLDNNCNGLIDEGCQTNTTNQSSTLFVSNPTDTKGNGILNYNYWSSADNYMYAKGFCQLRMGCSSAANVTLAADSQYSCRCDTYWGCEGKSCTAARGSWKRVTSVVCTGC